jgi:hypothetical protein
LVFSPSSHTHASVTVFIVFMRCEEVYSFIY